MAIVINTCIVYEQVRLVRVGNKQSRRMFTDQQRPWIKISGIAVSGGEHWRRSVSPSYSIGIDANLTNVGNIPATNVVVPHALVYPIIDGGTKVNLANEACPADKAVRMGWLEDQLSDGGQDHKSGATLFPNDDKSPALVSTTGQIDDSGIDKATLGQGPILPPL
jgi:hypothetical protein